MLTVFDDLIVNKPLLLGLGNIDMALPAIEDESIEAEGEMSL